MPVRSLALLLLVLSESVSACGPYRLAYRPQPGVFERLPDGSERGTDVSAVREMARRSGCRIETQVLSQKLAWHAFERGDIDLLPSTLITPERAELADMVPVVTGRVALLVHEEQARRSPDEATLLADPEARVLVQRGAAYPPEVQRWLDQPALRGRVTEVVDMPAAARVFQARKVAAMPFYPALAAHPAMQILERHPLWDIWKEAGLPGGLAMSRRTVSDLDRQRLRDALNAMLRDGSMQRILEEHFGAAVVRRTLKVHEPPLR